MLWRSRSQLRCRRQVQIACGEGDPTFWPPAQSPQRCARSPDLTPLSASRSQIFRRSLWRSSILSCRLWCGSGWAKISDARVKSRATSSKFAVLMARLWVDDNHIDSAENGKVVRESVISPKTSECTSSADHSIAGYGYRPGGPGTHVAVDSSKMRLATVAWLR